MKSIIFQLYLFIHSLFLAKAFAPTSIISGACRISSIITPTTRSTTSSRSRSTVGSGGLYLKDENMTEEEREAALEKATKAMTAFSNKYLANTGTTLCQDKSIPAVVIKGLAEHKVSLGTPLCPCRYYEDKEKEAKDGFWNCPCVPMRERHECHCMLFLTDDNAFAGDETKISVDEVKKFSGGP